MKWFGCKNLVLQPSRKIRRNGCKCFPMGCFFYMTLGIFLFYFLPKRRAEQTVDNLDIVQHSCVWICGCWLPHAGSKGSGTVVICTVWFLCLRSEDDFLWVGAGFLSWFWSSLSFVLRQLLVCQMLKLKVRPRKKYVTVHLGWRHL